MAIVLVILTTIIIACLPLLYACQSNLEVTFPEGKMKIGGIYGKEIPLGEIKEVQLCQSLPEISIRTNGFALGKTRIGHFRTAVGKGIMLFTHSDACFIRIVGKDDATYYLSGREEKDTRLLFLNIQKKLENAKLKVLGKRHVILGLLHCFPKSNEWKQREIYRVGMFDRVKVNPSFQKYI